MGINVTAFADLDIEVDTSFGSDFDLLVRAAEWVATCRTTATGKLGRKLYISFRRAEQLMSVLESLGIVGASQGEKGRDVLATSDEVSEMIATIRGDQPREEILGSR